MGKPEIFIEKELSEKGPDCPRCGGPIGMDVLPGVNPCAYCGGTIYIDPVRLPAAPIERPVSLKVARAMHSDEHLGLMQIHMEGIARRVYGKKREEESTGGDRMDFVEGMVAALNRTTEVETEMRNEDFWKKVAFLPTSEDGRPRSERYRAGYLDGLAYAIGVDEQTHGDDGNFYYHIGFFNRILSGTER